MKIKKETERVKRPVHHFSGEEHALDLSAFPAELHSEIKDMLFGNQDTRESRLNYV